MMAGIDLKDLELKGRLKVHVRAVIGVQDHWIATVIVPEDAFIIGNVKGSEHWPNVTIMTEVHVHGTEI